MFWLGHLLDNASYMALPAKSVPDAAQLVRQLNLTVDVLVINVALPGGVSFIADLRKANCDIRMIGVLNDSVEIANIPKVNAVHFKGSTLDETAKIDWLECVREVLAPRTATAGSLT